MKKKSQGRIRRKGKRDSRDIRQKKRKMTGSRNNEINPKEGLYDEGGKHTVHWFRKGLRLHDNPSLREGLAGASTFRCVFVLDPWFAGSTNIGINKWR